MPRPLKRLSLAFLLSVLGLTATMSWYYLGRPRRASEDGRAAVARLTRLTDEVQRRETTRVIWESVGLGEDLFGGEAIRTSPRASAEIKLNGGAVIHLDPDSLVVLEQNANGVALDFLEGNLFVQGAGDAKALTLKTGTGEIALNKADLSLSKGASGAVDLEVFRGRAELRQGTKTTALDESKGATLSESGVAERRLTLALSAPRAGEVVRLDLAHGEKLKLAWTPLAAGQTVGVEFGPARGKLSRWSATFKGEDGHGAIGLKPGKWFVRLVASAPGQPEVLSLITPFEVAPKAAPALLEPVGDQPILRTEQKQPITFRWLDRNPFAAHTLEVATDPGFRHVVATEKLGGDQDSVAIPLADGTYVWRVTGFADLHRPGVASPSARVRVTSGADAAPELKAPADGARVTPNVSLAWTARGPARVSVRDAKNEEVFQFEDADQSARPRDLAPGSYRWVVTVGERKSAEWHFTVAPATKLPWTIETDAFAYGGPRPSFPAAWLPVTGAAGYRYRVAPADHALGEAPWHQVASPKIDVPVASDGEYQLEVEALDPSGTTLATTPVRRVRVAARPPLSAPRWSKEGLRSDAGGNLDLEWGEVDGAKTYVLELKDPRGRVTERRVPRGPASLRKLHPGRYELKVRGVDEFSRPGEDSTVRTLEVPEGSNIRAPRIKAVKVR